MRAAISKPMMAMIHARMKADHPDFAVVKAPKTILHLNGYIKPAGRLHQIVYFQRSLNMDAMHVNLAVSLAPEYAFKPWFNGDEALPPGGCNCRLSHLRLYPTGQIRDWILETLPPTPEAVFGWVQDPVEEVLNRVEPAVDSIFAEFREVGLAWLDWMSERYLCSETSHHHV